MSAEGEQPTLWSQLPDDPDDARAACEQASLRWQEVRRRHAIGSAKEKKAWTAFRKASDRYWELLRSHPGE